MRPWLRVAVGAALLLGLAAPLWLRAAGPPSAPLAPGSVPLTQACRAAGMRYPPPNPRVVIRKSPRTLTLYSGDTLLKEYRMALGGKPDGDKEREGDRRTPLGKFYVCTRLQRSQFRRFLGLSYPDPEDARRGLRSGAITPAQHAAILGAHRRRRQPPWDTALGGAIGIHGGGAERDWTLGCIAVGDGEIDELFAVLPHGSRVDIVEE